MVTHKFNHQISIRAQLVFSLSGVGSEVLNVCNFPKVFKKYCDFRNKLAALFVTDNQEGYIMNYHGSLIENNVAFCALGEEELWVENFLHQRLIFPEY